jgi:hypothetical protein
MHLLSMKSFLSVLSVFGVDVRLEPSLPQALARAKVRCLPAASVSAKPPNSAGPNR